MYPGVIKFTKGIIPVSMEESLDGLFVNRIHREELICSINAHPEKFTQFIKIATISKHPHAWRAAWILAHCVYENDTRIRSHIEALIGALREKKDGHQRELLKILEKMDLQDDHEGYLFEECMNIWEAVGKSSSVRLIAFRILVKISQKYPELEKEIEFFTEPQYLESLSPGIKRLLNKILNGKK